jgi:hypothetical protein
MMFKVGDRVQAKPYNCSGTVIKVEWRKELKLTDNSSIPSNYVYWVELEGKDLKPRGFSSKCLKLINV